jgi:hypothetical protein
MLKVMQCQLLHRHPTRICVIQHTHKHHNDPTSRSSNPGRGVTHSDKLSSRLGMLTPCTLFLSVPFCMGTQHAMARHELLAMSCLHANTAYTGPSCLAVASCQWATSTDAYTVCSGKCACSPCQRAAAACCVARVLLAQRCCLHFSPLHALTGHAQGG